MCVEGLVEQVLKVTLPLKGPDCPQTLQGDDEMGENGAPSCDERRMEHVNNVQKQKGAVWI